MRVNDAAAHSPTALRDNPATVDRQHDAGIGLVHLLAPNLLPHPPSSIVSADSSIRLTLVRAIYRQPSREEINLATI